MRRLISVDSFSPHWNFSNVKDIYCTNLARHVQTWGVYKVLIQVNENDNKTKQNCFYLPLPPRNVTATENLLNGQKNARFATKKYFPKISCTHKRSDFYRLIEGRDYGMKPKIKETELNGPMGLSFL